MTIVAWKVFKLAFGGVIREQAAKRIFVPVWNAEARHDVIPRITHREIPTWLRAPIGRAF
jgi:hypothetical protein